MKDLIKKFKESGGQSVMEIIVAMAIFTLIASTMVSIAIGSFETINRSGEMIKAGLLADEAVAAIDSIKNRAWNEFIYARTAIGTSSDNSKWEFLGEGASDVIEDKYAREINFYPIFRSTSTNRFATSSEEGFSPDIMSKLAEVIVSWDDGHFNDARISAERRFVIYNDNSKIWKQNDWSGGSGNDVWNENNKYSSDDGNINNIASGSLVALKEISTSTFPNEGYLISSGTSSAGGIWEIVSWAQEKSEACPECQIVLQLQGAADSGGAPGAWDADWCGPASCDNNDFFATSSGEIITNPGLIGKEWLHYKAILKGNGSMTPVLKEVKIFYK